LGLLPHGLSSETHTLGQGAIQQGSIQVFIQIVHASDRKERIRGLHKQRYCNQKCTAETMHHVAFLFQNNVISPNVKYLKHCVMIRKTADLTAQSTRFSSIH
jgi:hypothetical protein